MKVGPVVVILYLGVYPCTPGKIEKLCTYLTRFLEPLGQRYPDQGCSGTLVDLYCYGHTSNSTASRLTIKLEVSTDQRINE